MPDDDRIAAAADQLTRYGGSVKDERLLDVLDLLTEINDDMHHLIAANLVSEACEKAVVLLRRVAADYTA